MKRKKKISRYPSSQHMQEKLFHHNYKELEEISENLPDFIKENTNAQSGEELAQDKNEYFERIRKGKIKT